MPNPPQVGQPIQVFTSRLDRQVEGIGAGPYAGQITRVFKGTMIDAQVYRPGNYPPYFVGSIMSEQDTKVEASPRIYWRPIPEPVAEAKPDVYVPPAGADDEIKTDVIEGDQT